MEPAGRPALKLMLRDLAAAQTSPSQSGLVFEGVPFDRVWVQGTVKQKLGGAFRLDDGTGEIPVVVTTPQLAQGVGAGCFALVVGKLVSGGGPKAHIKAHKVVNLSADEETVGARMMCWSSEVVEMQRKVYPLLAEQQ